MDLQLPGLNNAKAALLAEYAPATDTSIQIATAAAPFVDFPDVQEPAYYYATLRVENSQKQVTHSGRLKISNRMAVAGGYQFDVLDYALGPSGAPDGVFAVGTIALAVVGEDELLDIANKTTNHLALEFGELRIDEFVGGYLQDDTNSIFAIPVSGTLDTAVYAFYYITSLQPLEFTYLFSHTIPIVPDANNAWVQFGDSYFNEAGFAHGFTIGQFVIVPVPNRPTAIYQRVDDATGTEADYVKIGDWPDALNCPNSLSFPFNKIALFETTAVESYVQAGDFFAFNFSNGTQTIVDLYQQIGNYNAAAWVIGARGNLATVAQSGGGGSSVWGGITGTLSDQTDLQAELDGKSPTSHNHDGVYDAAGTAATLIGALAGALGSAAGQDVGTADGDVVQVQTGGKLPALDASDLTNIPGGTLSDGNKGHVTVASSGTVWTVNDGVVDAKISGAAAKTTPVDADQVGLIDSAASNVLKKLTYANLKAALKTYFDTLYTGGGGGSSASAAAQNFSGSAETLLASKSLAAGTYAFSALLGIKNPISSCAMSLHGEGTNGAAVTVDSTGKSFTNPSSAIVFSNVQAMFGATSVYFNNTAANYLQLAAHSDFDIGSGDFALYAMIYPIGLTGSLFVQRNASVSQGIFLQLASGAVLAYLGSGSWFVSLTSTAISANAWHKIKFYKKGNFYGLEIDNKLDKYAILPTPGAITTGLGAYIGRDNGVGGVPFNGYMRYLLLTRDVDNKMADDTITDMVASAPSATLNVRNAAGTVIDTISSSSTAEQKSGSGFTLASADLVKVYGSTPTRLAPGFAANINIA